MPYIYFGFLKPSQMFNCSKQLKNFKYVKYA